jgi:sec-independent protein translocase protein TatC
MPVVMYQVLAFVVPGLTRDERRWLLGVVAGGTLMFGAGVAFAYFVELPRMLSFMLKPNAGEVQPTIGVTTYINTVTRILLMTGLLFQTPLVIMALAKAGIIKSVRLVRAWRYAVVVSVVVASFLAPSINPLTPIVVGIPILGLYGLGILLAWLVEPRRREPASPEGVA